ncbi:MAG: FkbM family methyltransferase [Planctomycetaceae bacterium]|nr:FkbM family methyltransferase [Planctomycetaceae bacterium]
MPSEAGQLDWVLATLAHQRQGYFVDLGAWDGLESSNTLELERDYGWTGLCIEPLRYQALTRYRRCHCVQAWCSNGEHAFDVIEEGQCSRLVSPAGGNQIRTRTLTSVLLEVGAPPTIDYFSLDVEGAELQVLQGISFELYRFRAITMEVDKPTAPAAIDYLISKGYAPVHEFRMGDYLLDLGFVPARR